MERNILQEYFDVLIWTHAEVLVALLAIIDQCASYVPAAVLNPIREYFGVKANSRRSAAYFYAYLRSIDLF